MCKWKINFAALGRKVCRKRPLFVPKMGVSQLKSEEEVCRDSENGRKTLPCFGSGSGDLHAHRGQGFVPQNLDSTCCKSPFGLPSGTTSIQRQKVVTRRLHEIGRRNLPLRQILSSICRCGKTFGKKWQDFRVIRSSLQMEDKFGRRSQTFFRFVP